MFFADPNLKVLKSLALYKLYKLCKSLVLMALTFKWDSVLLLLAHLYHYYNLMVCLSLWWAAPLTHYCLITFIGPGGSSDHCYSKDVLAKQVFLVWHAIVFPKMLKNGYSHSEKPFSSLGIPHCSNYLVDHPFWLFS